MWKPPPHTPPLPSPSFIYIYIYAFSLNIKPYSSNQLANDALIQSKGIYVHNCHLKTEVVRQNLEITCCIPSAALCLFCYCSLCLFKSLLYSAFTNNALCFYFCILLKVSFEHLICWSSMSCGHQIVFAWSLITVSFTKPYLNSVCLYSA